MKAENALAKVEAFLKPANRTADPESLTDEERFMFRKLGLRMKAFLLLGKIMFPLIKFVMLFLSAHSNYEMQFTFQAGVEFSMGQWRICICIGSTGNWLRSL